MLSIRDSIKEDVVRLKETILESFVQASIEDYGNEKTLPPGVIDGQAIDKGFNEHECMTILYNDSIIGGVIVILNEAKDHYLQALWVIKEFQNKGIGKKAIAYIENKFPDSISWHLETPEPSKRNRRFYENLDYIKVGEQSFDNGKIVLINYKKMMK